jgi:CDP-diacylglycerol--serine O-phosphatidyltransferase
MEMKPSGSPQRTGMRRVVVVMPSAFTLGNLFFGFWAIVSAYNGGYLWAGWFIIFAGVLDGLDGRVARASNTGTRFGAELDSLVDVISFGIAPALLIYFEELSTAGRFAWVLCFMYVVCAALRLARYNVTAAQGGRPSAWFTGLPSPGAGGTLAVFFAFSQTPLYRNTIAVYNGQHAVTVTLMLLLGFLMVSNVKYPRFPSAGFRTPSQLAGLTFYLVSLAGGLIIPEYYLFLLGATYVVFGIGRAAFVNLSERNDDRAHDDQRPITLVPPAHRARRGRRNWKQGE